MSEEEKYTRYLHEFSRALLVVLGIVFTLLIITVAGDTMWYRHGAPFGWFSLWFITTIGSVPLGVAMLIGSGGRNCRSRYGGGRRWDICSLASSTS